MGRFADDKCFSQATSFRAAAHDVTPASGKRRRPSHNIPIPRAPLGACTIWRTEAREYSTMGAPISVALPHSQSAVTWAWPVWHSGAADAAAARDATGNGHTYEFAKMTIDRHPMPDPGLAKRGRHRRRSCNAPLIGQDAPSLA